MLYRLREEGGVLQRILFENIRMKGLSLLPHFSQKTREMGHPDFSNYLRMPSFPMTVL
jgi:hypothetical protein